MSENQDQVTVVPEIPAVEVKKSTLKKVIKKTAIATVVVAAGAFVVSKLKGDKTDPNNVMLVDEATPVTDIS